MSVGTSLVASYALLVTGIGRASYQPVTAMRNITPKL